MTLSATFVCVTDWVSDQVCVTPDKYLRYGSDSQVLVVPFVAGIYSAIEYRLHVEMLSEEYSGKKKTSLRCFVISEKEKKTREST